MPGSGTRIERILRWLIAALVLSAAYLYTFPQANIFYAVIVLLHAAGGVLATLFLIPLLLRLVRSGSLSSRAGWLLIAVGAVLGLILIKTGTLRTEWNKLYLHILFSVAGVGLLLAGWWAARVPSESGPIGPRLFVGAVRVVLCLGVLAGIGYGARYIRESWQSRNRIQNPGMPPDTMNGEGDGPEE